ncbi:MAG: hypothetical protein HY707_07570 [Ignavibacteriae bacterium]|nr:hypothetical protein [Ignavibacteriota bacterium]
MSLESVLFIIILFAIALLAIYFRTFVKSTVEESIKNQFETQRQKMREDFEREMNAFERQDKFRLAALDKRMEAHQKAFALARKMALYTYADKETRSKVGKECDAFLDESGLYLTEEARLNFWGVLRSFTLFHFLEQELETYRGDEVRYDEHYKKIEEASKLIAGLPAKLVRSVDSEASGKTDYLMHDRNSPLPRKAKENNL